MIRVRFQTESKDYRPVNWPVEFPYWCTGFNDDHSTLISYADTEAYILKNWPEAKNIEIDMVDKIEFSDRFPRPEWYQNAPTP